jgi:hypothetical protein
MHLNIVLFRKEVITMRAKQETEGEAGPLKINIEYQDSKGQTQKKGLKYGGERQDFYDGVHEIRKEMDKGKKK